MRKFVESNPVQYLIILLLVVDIALLATELTIEAALGHPTNPPEWLAILEEVIFGITLVILVTFEVELLILIFVYTWRFFCNCFYVSDFIVVTAAIVLEIVFKNELVQFLALLRLWRVLRIGESRCKNKVNNF